MSIAIVDYGMANLRSVQKALERINYDAPVTSDPTELSDTDCIVLPGVGAFDKAVKNLKERDLWSVIDDHLSASKPFLGICLGLQLLFEGSEEGTAEGFGRFDGICRRFSEVEPVPHMGWNDVDWRNMTDVHNPGDHEPQCYYFVHSYYPDPTDEDLIAGATQYGKTFCSAARSRNIFGVQFHPEKSQFAGFDLLENFLSSVESRNPV